MIVTTDPSCVTVMNGYFDMCFCSVELVILKDKHNAVYGVGQLKNSVDNVQTSVQGDLQCVRSDMSAI